VHERAALLRGIPAFAGLESTEVEDAASSFRELEFPAGGQIMREGERGARVLAFFVLLEGSVRVSAGGRELRRCGPGDIIGEIGLIEKAPRSATVIAETDVRCLGLSAWSFRALVDKHPALAERLTESAVSRRPVA
jgi:CRP-like cAMP-binding protein